MNEKTKQKIVKLLLDGLNYDGGHHKQYYLEQSLKLLLTKKEFEELKEDYQWDWGCPA